MSGKEVPVSIKRKYREFISSDSYPYSTGCLVGSVGCYHFPLSKDSHKLNASLLPTIRTWFSAVIIIDCLLISKKYTFLFPRIGKIPENRINTWPRRSEIEIGDLELG